MAVDDIDIDIETLREAAEIADRVLERLRAQGFVDYRFTVSGGVRSIMFSSGEHYTTWSVDRILGATRAFETCLEEFVTDLIVNSIAEAAGGG